MRRFLCILFSVVGTMSMGQSIEIESVDTANIIEYNQDDPILEAMDSMHTKKLFESYAFSSDIILLNTHDFPLDSIPKWTPEIITDRINCLNEQTPIDLVYNERVQYYIDAYAVKRRLMISKTLGLAELYFPMFEEELDKAGLPMELKYLPIVESALNPNAKSRAGAVGMWQFMYRTGRYLGLRINSYEDERMDPLRSTQVAIKYLKHLYEIYGDWNLALAAYNSGPGNVNKAIRRSGGHKNYWAIRPFLPEETRNYVPAFIAMVYVMNHASDHNIYPIEPRFTARNIDTVHVKQACSFEQIAQVLCMDYADLAYLNPSYKSGYIPVQSSDSIAFPLVLPVHLIGDFVMNESNIYKLQLKEKTSILDHQLLAVQNETIHRVRKGESLGLIAQRYGVQTSELRAWNNLSRKSYIYPGQKLIIYKSGETAQNKTKEETTYNGYVYYTIQSGDTLWDIAKLYDGISAEDIKKINNFSGNMVLRPGMKIKIKTT